LVIKGAAAQANCADAASNNNPNNRLGKLRQQATTPWGLNMGNY
jgi:hypothetical protein